MLRDFEHFEVDESVVDRNSLTRAQIIDEVSIVDVDAPLLGIVGQHGEEENVARLEV